MASNDYYKHSSGQPAVLSRGASAAIRAEFDAIQVAFDKLPSVVDLNSKTGGSSAQSGSSVTGTTGGTSDVITGTFTPTIFALSSGMMLRIPTIATNTTATPTFQADGTAAKTIVNLNNLPLGAGDLGKWAELLYDGTLDKYVLINPTQLDKVKSAALAASGGAATVGTTPAGSLASTNVQSALNELDAEKQALLPQASSSASGYLSSTDWVTFNSKQASLGFTPANAAGQIFSGPVAVPAGATGAQAPQAQEVVALTTAKLVGPVGPTITYVTGQTGAVTANSDATLQGTPREINYQLQATWTGTNTGGFASFSPGVTPAGYTLKSMSGGGVIISSGAPIVSGVASGSLLYITATNGVPVTLNMFVTYTKN